ncbi:MAG: nuclease-related domain-containing protein [Trebonia sp.]
MAWPRTKKPRSSTLPAAREHEGVHVTAASAPDPDRESGQNTGISGTRHAVVDDGQSQAARPRAADMNTEMASPEASATGVIEGTVITGTPADALAAASSGYPRSADPDAGHTGRRDGAGGSYDETSGIVYEVPPDQGFAALGLDPDSGQAGSGGGARAAVAEPPAAEDPATPPIAISGLDQMRASPQGDSSAQPTWNQTTASIHGAEEEKRGGLLASFGGLFARSGGEAEDDGSDQPPLTRLRDLPLDQKLRIWRIRALIVVAVGVVFSIISDWEIGLTLAIVAGIADTIYRARTVESHHWHQPGTVDRATWRAQKRTQKQLARMERAGYVSLYRRPIPDSVEVIDHLVVGPTGVYAIDSEKWDKDLPIRAKNNKTLFHGPQSMKDRIEHAKWEAGQASERLSEAMGAEVSVRPALAIYGPKIPWDILCIREVDVFSGDRLKTYLNRRARDKKARRLSAAEIGKIHTAASTVLPLAAGKAATPVG